MFNRKDAYLIGPYVHRKLQDDYHVVLPEICIEYTWNRVEK